ncbi:MAG: hypothetical protein OXT67_13600, partial [Zetaproteobacteria bacterium]|nr:hypothetical protein [Zetaproteobacteria bacterium]
ILYVPISTHILAVFPHWGVILERCDRTMMAEVAHGDDLGPYAEIVFYDPEVAEALAMLERMWKLE